MKGNLMFRLLLRSVVNVIASVVLAFISLMVILFTTEVAAQNFRSFRNLGAALFNIFGATFLYTMVGVFLFLIYFCFMQWMLFHYFNKVNETVKQIADGTLNLNHQVPVKLSNPFSMLSANVNRLSARLENALDEERRAEQTKNELITNVSHDLRTPLTSVIGYLGLIEQDRYRDEVELRYYVQIAYEKSQRLHVLIDDLFEYTRMRHDSVNLHKEQVNIVELLGQLLAQYHLPLQEAGMVSQMSSSSPTVMIEADPAMLARVFENLIANAMHYGKEGKKLILHTEVLGREIAVDVVNYGEPISAIDLPHLFERFYRVDKSRTQWDGGSGLGLAICKSIVEKHGGRIEVTSSVEQTVFRIYLPVFH